MTDSKANRSSKSTKTSSFGSPGRQSHDSTSFYDSRLYQNQPQESELSFIENQVPEDTIDTIFAKSSESMSELPDQSVHIVVTSPPYNVGKEYDDNLGLTEYRTFLKRVWSEVNRVLVLGGRVCINIANLGRKPYLPLNGYITQDMECLGFLNRGEIIWNKGSSSGSSTAWGSWKSAKNPTLRDVHEYIMVFSKGLYSRKDVGRKDTITKNEFLEYTKSIWTFKTVSAKKIGHPAPFPLELPYRLIQLYSFEGEVVLDPFVGSGQTAIAAIESDRHFIGYEKNEAYVKIANRRIQEFKSEKKDTYVDVR